MDILIACEMSGRVREAFRNMGHSAWSCDLLPSLIPSPYHIQEDIIDTITMARWDMIIAFPPCTHLCSSGARYFKEKRANGTQQFAIDLFMKMVNADCPKIAIENPIGIMSSLYRKPDQIIQPWQFGHPETKSTCLWLKGLPLLRPSNIVDGREHRIHHMSPSPNRSMLRSLTYQGIADAMVCQWG